MLDICMNSVYKLVVSGIRPGKNVLLLASQVLDKCIYTLTWRSTMDVFLSACFLIQRI